MAMFAPSNMQAQEKTEVAILNSKTDVANAVNKDAQPDAETGGEMIRIPDKTQLDALKFVFRSIHGEPLTAPDSIGDFAIEKQFRNKEDFDEVNNPPEGWRLPSLEEIEIVMKIFSVPDTGNVYKRWIIKTDIRENSFENHTALFYIITFVHKISKKWEKRNMYGGNERFDKKRNETIYSYWSDFEHFHVFYVRNK
jgi:hypothetical protein